ncbi:putative exported or periplasmic protein in ApbE locus [Methylophaga frappieri]|uniref:Putative exported or periplasmic protein in ApbE locus n=1 Tax=Methylophaga frappieri (strain ATCC BAA-2434 / DSM 25690 / JAM7) TaxID=754477 RepID=I1YIW5_METFJ|nr:(Na+)-NQR maturation NqrM [Methylophaga frappieri]AFJ02858.1 putative exported or periplasmic protein in ApbE locus [Methylophaga frappieri]
MSTFIAAFVILLVVIAAMAIGVLFGRNAIQGSCGGLGAMGLSGSCGGACSLEEKRQCATRQESHK